MPKILIIDSNPLEKNEIIREESGLTTGEGYAAVLQELRSDVTCEIVCPYDGDVAPDPAAFDGVVFTGSAVDWSTEDPRTAPLADVMRDVFAKSVPAIGSCNGMQLAASVLGGLSDASPNGREDGLARNIEVTDHGATHPMMAGRETGFSVPCVHRDEVRRLPEGAVLLATNAHSRVQAFAYERDGVRFWGMQYHPEFTPAFVGAYLGSVGRVSPQDAADLMAAETDAAAAARLGTTPQAQQLPQRAVELANWLEHL